MLAGDECAKAKPFQRDLPQVWRMPERDGNSDIGLATVRASSTPDDPITSV